MDNKERVKEILAKARRNMERGSKDFFRPLPKEESEIIREHFANSIDLDLNGNSGIRLCNSNETLVAIGYERVVIGDYGPYMEFSKYQIVLKNIERRWSGEPSRLVKYIWMQTKDSAKTKIYWQRGVVPYADYKVGMYYASPLEIYYSDEDE